MDPMLRSLLLSLSGVALSGQAVPTNVRMQKRMKSFVLAASDQDPWHPGSPAAPQTVSYTATDLPHAACGVSPRSGLP
jgi:hypothetical protein